MRARRRYVRHTLLAAGEERCALCTLSEVLAQQHLAHVDLLKIDVEGAELDVLRGVLPADWPRIRQVPASVCLLGTCCTLGASQAPAAPVPLSTRCM
jgi:FkbM family methyltransferase